MALLFATAPPLIRFYLLWQKPLVRPHLLNAFGSSGSSHGKVLDYGSSHPFAYSSRQSNSAGGAGPWGAPGVGGSQLKRPGMGSGGPFGSLKQGGGGPMGSQPKVQRRLEPGGAISFGEVAQLSVQLDKAPQHVE